LSVGYAFSFYSGEAVLINIALSEYSGEAMSVNMASLYRFQNIISTVISSSARYGSAALAVVHRFAFAPVAKLWYIL
jgi:hypothetical protein